MSGGVRLDRGGTPDTTWHLTGCQVKCLPGRKISEVDTIQREEAASRITSRQRSQHTFAQGTEGILAATAKLDQRVEPVVLTCREGAGTLADAGLLKPLDSHTPEEARRASLARSTATVRNRTLSRTMRPKGMVLNEYHGPRRLLRSYPRETPISITTTSTIRPPWRLTV